MEDDTLWPCPTGHGDNGQSEVEVMRFEDSDGSPPSWSDGDDGPLPRPEQAWAWTAALTMPAPAGLQAEALAALQRMSAGDIVANEFWPDILESLALALDDADPVISDGVLRLLLRLFHAAAAEQTADLFVAVACHVRRAVATAPPDQCPATLAADDPAFPRWRLRFRAVWKMAHDLPAHWLAFRPPQEAAVLAAAGDLLALRLPLLSLSCDAPGSWRFLDHGSPTPSPPWLSTPLVYFVLLDPEALWFQRWCRRAASRRPLMAALRTAGLLPALLRLCCHDGLPADPLAGLQCGENPPQPSAAPSSSPETAVTRLLVLHAATMVGQCLQYEEGREAIDATELPAAVLGRLQPLCADPTPVRLVLQALLLQLAYHSLVPRPPPISPRPTSPPNLPTANPFAPQRSERLATVVHETVWRLAQGPPQAHRHITLDHLGLLLQPVLALPTEAPFPSRSVAAVYHVAAALLRHPHGRSVLLAALPARWSVQPPAAAPPTASALHALLAHAERVIRHGPARPGRRVFGAAVAFVRTVARHPQPASLLEPAGVVAALLHSLQQLQPLEAPGDGQSPLEHVLLDSLADLALTPAAVLPWWQEVGPSTLREPCLLRLLACLLTREETARERRLVGHLATVEDALVALFRCCRQAVGSDLRTIAENFNEGWEPECFHPCSTR
eukprot:EG_transcript_5353